MQFRVGVVVLATLLITLILLLLFGEWQTLWRTTHTYYVEFTEAPGVSRYTPIHMSGILIGRVARVDLAKDGRAIITAEIDSKREIRQNHVCRLKTSLLGDATLLFVRSEDPRLPDTPLAPGAMIKGAVARDPLEVVADLQQKLNQASTSVFRSSEDFDRVVNRINRLIEQNEKQISEIIPHANETVRLLRDTMQKTNELVGDPEIRQSLKQSMQRLPQLMEQGGQTLARVNQSLALLDDNLRGLKQVLGPLGEQGAGLATRLDQSIQKFDAVMDQMHRFSQDLNSQQGSLGQLVHNPELYNNLNQAAMNIEQLTRQLRPILHDARVFSDKIARHPELLGVRGVIERRPGIK